MNEMLKRNKKKVSKKDAQRIERAIHFLSEKYRQSGFNEKPVVLHSIEVAFFLLKSGAGADIVIIAILHDLLEHSGVSFENIEKDFGEKIARGVLSLTEDKKIKKYEKRYKEMFERMVGEGEEMVLVKLADMYHSSFYLDLEKDAKKRKLVLDKLAHLLDIARGIKYKEIYEATEKRYLEELDKYNKAK